jgi:hypothetical protein
MKTANCQLKSIAGERAKETEAKITPDAVQKMMDALPDPELEECIEELEQHMEACEGYCDNRLSLDVRTMLSINRLRHAVSILKGVISDRKSLKA